MFCLHLIGQNWVTWLATREAEKKGLNVVKIFGIDPAVGTLPSLKNSGVSLKRKKKLTVSWNKKHIILASGVICAQR